MEEPKREALSGEKIRILLAADPSAEAQRLAPLLSKQFLVAKLEGKSFAPEKSKELLKDISAVALLINAKSGVSQAMIDFWNYISERQFPRMVIINGLSMNEIDFDDIVLIVNRVLEQGVTPYLVLHDEVGEPVGLISLDSKEVHDYSGSKVNKYSADSELLSLVEEFATEYQELISGLGSDSFASGLIVPILPVVEEKFIGINEINAYLNLLK